MLKSPTDKNQNTPIHRNNPYTPQARELEGCNPSTGREECRESGGSTARRGKARIGEANRRKGQRPFSKTSETSEVSFCRGASNCRSDGGLIIGARCARIDIRKHCAPIIKRRINGDFTRPAGVEKIGIANFSVGGKTPCSIV